MGVIYNWGRGVPQDYFAAVNWYHRAALQGVAAAQSALGDMYDNGDGVPRNAVEAYRWYTKAAAGGDREALRKRKALAKTMSPEELATARDRTDGG